MIGSILPLFFRIVSLFYFGVTKKIKNIISQLPQQLTEVKRTSLVSEINRNGKWGLWEGCLEEIDLALKMLYFSPPSFPPVYCLDLSRLAGSPASS